MLEIKIGEHSATVAVLKGGFNIRDTATMISHAYLTAALTMTEKGRNKEVTIKVINGLMDGVDRALREADPSCTSFMDLHNQRGVGFESMFFGMRGDRNA